MTEHEIANFRLARNHLLSGKGHDPVTICRDICGAQAQIQPAAYLQLWTRNHSITRALIEDALWKKRTLIKTSLMRQTVHIIPSDEFWLYISALKPSRLAGPLRIMSRFGIDREEAEALTGLIMEALSSAPMGRAGIVAAVRPKVSKRVRAWMEKVWSIVRLPVAEGLICYGSGEGNEVSWIRTERWLKHKAKPITSTAAQKILVGKYLRAYGPATLRDFSHWAGIPMAEVRQLNSLLDGEFAEVEIAKQKCLLHGDDLALFKKPGQERSIRLLPHFDPYLLAHREKDHLLPPAHYKRVYRNQGWISPVVLIGGSIAGIWSYKAQSSSLQVRIEPFTKFSAAARAQVEQEAGALAGFYGAKLEVSFG